MITPKKLISLFVLCGLVGTVFAGSPLNYPGGRIAISHDGNNFDKDDFVAAAMNLALLDSTGLKKQLVHYDYSCHIGENLPDQYTAMEESVRGGIERFEIDDSVVFDAQKQLDELIANFKKEAEKSSASDPLWFIICGPMEVPWRCIEAVAPEKRKFIHCVSHSGWNNGHTFPPEMTKKKKDVVELGVVFHDIKNQNKTGWNTEKENAFWMRDSADEDLRWLYERNAKSTYDTSDSGMLWWLMTGADIGGDQDGGWRDYKPLLESDVVKYTVRTSIPRRNLKLAPSGNEYYVAMTGKDSNPGTREKPFRTIQKYADIAQPGDICLVREGTYRESVRPKNGGRTGDPIRYVAYPGEKVTISGLETVTGKWKRHHGSIYKIKVDTKVEQLFVNGDMMVEARWPNMPFEDLWERSAWANSGKGSQYEKMKDPNLAETGIDWTGAIATLNVAHQFHTWTRRVSKHEKGSDTFEYVGNMGKLSGTIGSAYHFENDYYYLSGKLEALDIATEWFYDTNSKMLYLWTPDGKSPAEHSVEVKVRERGFHVEGLDEIHLVGFDFLGTTFQFKDTVHSLVDDCHLLFPTYARELPERRGGSQLATGMSGSHNIIRNCSLGYTPLSGFVMDGPHSMLANNLIHDVCWNGSLRFPAIRLGAGEEAGDEWNPTFVKGNTVYNIGSAGIGFRGQTYVVEYNYVHHAGLMSHDVAAIYTSGPATQGSIVRYNWVHNCHPEMENGKNIGLGIRADDQCRNMRVHHNVVWDCGIDGIIMKGEYHKVYNNTVFHTAPEFKFANSIRMDTEPEPYKAWRKDAALYSEQNMHSLVFNNVVGLIRAYHKNPTPFVHKSNVIHNELSYHPEVVDWEHYDFRPRERSNLIDTGVAIPGITEHYEGDAPDIGAYEFGGVNWRPGYKPDEALFYKLNREYDKLTD